MADQADTGGDGKTYRNGVLQVSSSPASPGPAGAIKDAVAALAQAFAPKALTDRGKRVDKAVNDDSGALGNQF